MEEKALITGLQQGEPSAVDALVLAYGNRLLRAAFSLCGNPTDAQDIVQDTLVQAIQSIQRFRGDAALYTWLHGILLNMARRHRRRQGKLIPVENLPEEPNETQERPGPAGALVADEDAAALFAALQTISEEHREILVLRYFENQTIAQISDALGIPGGTVKSRLHYAVDALRKKMDKKL